MTSSRLRLAYVPGSTPAKWARIWAERFPAIPLILTPVAAADAASLLRSGEVDVAILRLPTDTTTLAVIPLYDETTVVVVPTDHLFSAVDEISPGDLDGEPVIVPRDDTLHWPQAPDGATAHRPETTVDAIDLVAAGLGVLVAPQSLARLHHRKDLTYRPIPGAPQSPVALAVPSDHSSELVADFIGIVRGRKPDSSRGEAPPAHKRTARQKTLAKQAARAAAKSAQAPSNRRKPNGPKRTGRDT